MLRNAARARRESDDIRDVTDAAYSLSTLGSPFAFPHEQSGGGGVILAYAPYARINVFQSLLYTEAWQFGVAPLPSPDLLSLADLPWPGRTICHFHWLAPLTARGEKPSVQQRVELFARLLQKLKKQNRKIVWTVHNILPHDAPNVEAAIAVRRLIADAADAIHVMNPGTATEMAPYLSLPAERTFYSPHPSYVGAYPDFATRENARFELGIEPDATVFLCFGAIQPYKGIEEFLAASRALAIERPHANYKFVIAGPPQDPATVKALLPLLKERDDLIVHHERVQTEDVQHYFRAADFAVCPYRVSLNSGTAMLALSFGIPIVAPDIGSFPQVVQKSTGLLYSSNDHTGLARAMAQAADSVGAFSQADCRAFAETLRPAIASRRFFEGLIGLPGFWG